MLDGVYIGLEFSKFYAGSINHRLLIFYPDGWVQDGMPGAGLDGFSFVSYRSNPTNQGSVGRYRVEGMQISMIWQEWPTDREFIRLDVNAADFREPSVYIAACRCTGTRFAGVYEWDEKSTLEFSLEGTFVDRRVIDQLDTDLGFFNTPRVRHGTYLIQNNSLILTYSDGQRLKTSFAASALGEQRQTVDWISIFSYQILYRRGYRPPP